MNDSETRPRRSLGVVLLDGMLRLAFGAAPTPKITETAGAPRRRRAGRYLLAAGVLVAVAATALLVVVLVRSPDDPTPGPGPAAALPGPQSRPPTPGATPTPTATVSSSPSASASVSDPVSASATTPTSAGPATKNGSAPAGGASVPLGASYATTAVGLLGYQMTVTVANAGQAARDGWQLAVTFPRASITVGAVTGATATQDGAVWTFAPDSTTKRVAASGQVQIGFTVHGATLIDAAPTDCRIDRSPCTAE